MVPTVPRSTSSSGWLARKTTATGQSAPYDGASSLISERIRVIARCSTSVALVAAKADNDSLEGIAVDRAWVRVSTTDWVSSGTVSSLPSKAAAAAYAGTPGVTSQAMPAASSRRVCSVRAE